LEYRDPATLAPNPGNWKRHPPQQLRALKGLLNEVGWAGALLFNERTGRLIDGHARRRLAAGRKVPLLIGSWSAEDERKILATLDPVGQLARPDDQALARLLKNLEADDQRLDDLLASLRDGPSAASAAKPIALPATRFEVIVECKDEKTQQRIFHRMTRAGHRCRVVTF